MGAKLLPRNCRRRSDFAIHRPLVARFLLPDARRPHRNLGHRRRLRLPAGLQVHLQARQLEWNTGKAVRASHPGHRRREALRLRQHLLVLQQQKRTVNIRKRHAAGYVTDRY